MGFADSQLKRILTCGKEIAPRLQKVPGLRQRMSSYRKEKNRQQPHLINEPRKNKKEEIQVESQSVRSMREILKKKENSTF